MKRAGRGRSSLGRGAGDTDAAPLPPSLPPSLRGSVPAAAATGPQPNGGAQPEPSRAAPLRGRGRAAAWAEGRRRLGGKGRGGQRALSPVSSGGESRQDRVPGAEGRARPALHYPAGRGPAGLAPALPGTRLAVLPPAVGPPLLPLVGGTVLQRGGEGVWRGGGGTRRGCWGVRRRR